MAGGGAAWRVMLRLLLPALLLLAYAQGVRGDDDIVQPDDEKAPKMPGCDNDFVLVRCSTFVR